MRLTRPERRPALDAILERLERLERASPAAARAGASAAAASAPEPTPPEAPAAAAAAGPDAAAATPHARAPVATVRPAPEPRSAPWCASPRSSAGRRSAAGAAPAPRRRGPGARRDHHRAGRRLRPPDRVPSPSGGAGRRAVDEPDPTGGRSVLALRVAPQKAVRVCGPTWRRRSRTPTRLSRPGGDRGRGRTAAPPSDGHRTAAEAPSRSTSTPAELPDADDAAVTGVDLVVARRSAAARLIQED